MFRRNKEVDVYTPQREDENKDRKKIAIAIVVVIIGLVIGWQVLKPNAVPGGTPLVKVDQTGQTPGASMFTPAQQAANEKAIAKEDGTIPDQKDEKYGAPINKSIDAAIDYTMYNLSRDDNPAIKSVKNNKVFERMASEKDRWGGVYYHENYVFEMVQLFNITNKEPLKAEELKELKKEGRAVANPGEAYGLAQKGLTVEDITPKDSPFYVVDVNAIYKSENSLPVQINVTVHMSAKGRIFKINPIGTETLNAKGE